MTQAAEITGTQLWRTTVSTVLTTDPVIEIHCLALDEKWENREEYARLSENLGDSSAARIEGSKQRRRLLDELYRLATERYGLRSIDDNRVNLATQVRHLIDSSSPEWSNPDTFRFITAVFELPVPIFGSPPQAFESLIGLVARAGSVVTTAYLASNGHPVLAVFSTTGTFIVWAVRPSARMLRRKMSDRIADAVGMSMVDEDFD